MLVCGVAGITLVGFLAVAVLAQDPGSKNKASNGQSSPSRETNPLKRPLTETQKKTNAKAFQKEISKTYKKWLDEDVRWIIADEERATFKQLFAKLYNLGIDQQTDKPSATVEYEITNLANHKWIVHAVESIQQMGSG